MCRRVQPADHGPGGQHKPEPVAVASGVGGVQKRSDEQTNTISASATPGGASGAGPIGRGSLVRPTERMRAAVALAYLLGDIPHAVRNSRDRGRGQACGWRPERLAALSGRRDRALAGFVEGLRLNRQGPYSRNVTFQVPSATTASR